MNLSKLDPSLRNGAHAAKNGYNNSLVRSLCNYVADQYLFSPNKSQLSMYLKKKILNVVNFYREK